MMSVVPESSKTMAGYISCYVLRNDVHMPINIPFSMSNLRSDALVKLDEDQRP